MFMETMHNAINWFEIPVTDFDRAKKFYSTIYDFEMFETTTREIRMGFLPYEQAEHRVGGAICSSVHHIPSKQGTTVYLNGGSDLNTVMNRIESAGGKIVQSKTFIGNGLGYIAFFLDTEGNKVGLHSRK